MLTEAVVEEACVRMDDELPDKAVTTVVDELETGIEVVFGTVEELLDAGLEDDDVLALIDVDEEELVENVVELV